jgi:hypothetical protein
MKTKQYNESFVKHGSTANASMFYEVDGKKFKFSYEHGNAFERHEIQLFDGLKMNHIADLPDLNEKRNSSAYIMNEAETKTRVTKLFEKSKKYVETLIK